MAVKENWKELKEGLKESWDRNKGKVKTGLICFGIGTIYGLIKTTNSLSTTIAKLSDKIPYDRGDISEYLYSNLDNPEVLEEVRETVKEIDELET